MWPLQCSLECVSYQMALALEHPRIFTPHGKSPSHHFMNLPPARTEMNHCENF